MKKIVFIAGLPRSGSTLLCQILNQNIKFYASPTSGVLGTLQSMKASFSNDGNWKGRDRETITPEFANGMRGFVEGFYGDKDVVFDKNRQWTKQHSVRMAIEMFGPENVKIIFPYRYPLHVVQSMENGYTKNPLLYSTDEASGKYGDAFQTMKGRVEYFCGPKNIMTMPMVWLRDLEASKLEHLVHVVPYKGLCENPQEELDRIHAFIGEDPYSYDFENVQQVTHENDELNNNKFSHKIAEGPVRYKDPEITLTEDLQKYVIKKYQNFNTFVNNRYLASRPEIKNNPLIQ